MLYMRSENRFYSDIGSTWAMNKLDCFGGVDGGCVKGTLNHDFPSPPSYL